MSLATKYRPKTFDDVVEQPIIVDCLRNMCSKEKLENRNMLLVGPAGTGKAQPLYSKVLTTNGFIEMRDVHVGTKVITANGNLASVSGVYPQGVRPIYEITLSDRTKIRVSDEHLNVVYRYNQDKKQIEHFIINTNYLIKLQKESRFKLRVEIPSVDFIQNDTDIPIDPYLLGFILGDGVLSSGNFCVLNNQDDVLSKIDSILRRDWNRTLRLSKDSTRNYRIVPVGETDDLEYSFRDAVKDLGLNVKSVDKSIPKMYLTAPYSVRLRLLQGMFDADGTIRSNGSIVYTTCSKQLSDDFAFLVRSLGIKDSISVVPAKEKSDDSDVHPSSETYWHRLAVPNSVEFFTSEKHRSRYQARKYPICRNIVSIEYIGDEKCQCIYVDHEDHTYISDDFIPTHNTTIGRLIGNALNGCETNVIELDAASNNGVENMRDIVAQAKTFPIGMKYKTFLVDECVTGDTEVLTDSGYKRFDSVTEEDLFAQYNDDGSIEFVKPIRLIKNQYDGDLICWEPKQGHRIRMTPHHVQPMYYVKSGKVKEKYICDVKFGQGNNLIASGHGSGAKEHLTPIDRLAIACQADGSIQTVCKTYTRWLISLRKERKISRLLSLFNDAGIEYNEVKSSRPRYRRFTFSMPSTVTKTLTTHFSLSDFSYIMAREFVDEVRRWDGHTGKNHYEYLSSVKENTDFVSAVATLGGYICNQIVVVDNRKETYKDLYRVFMRNGTYRQCQAIKKTIRYEPFSGYVYCVEVPSHKIIVRAEGLTFVTGNCHSLSNAAWQSLLKVLEESPAKSVFIFCTTNPEKIPDTIISRLQVFRLSKISLDGIFNRLKYILDKEQIQYDEDAVMLIAKLSGGGMRDAITMLDKSLSYSSELTSNSVELALNLPNYNDFFNLLGAYAKHDNASVTSILTSVYESDSNFMNWIEAFQAFVINVMKYVYLRDINKTSIPEHYNDKLSVYSDAHAFVCLKLSNVLLQMLKDIKDSRYQLEIALSYLCVLKKGSGSGNA